MISGLQDVSIHVASMERAISFYQDVLGLRLVEEGDHFSAFDLGGIRFGLEWTGGAEVPPLPHDDGGPKAGVVLSLRVRDLFSVVDHLTDEGVRFLGEIESHNWGSVIAFADPDGNVLKLTQPFS